MCASVQVRFPSKLIPAFFLERPNRFALYVRLADGTKEYVHLPDPGRLKELLQPSAKLWLIPVQEMIRRKTRYEVLLVETATGLISVDTRLPTALIRLALERQAIPEFAMYTTVHPEVRYGRSRIDFLLSANGLPDLLLEVKSVTLVEDGIGLFPDAVTARGTRHVQELVAATHQGYRAAVLFVVQREDAQAVAPHEGNDPAFAQALRQAATARVRLVAYTCRLTLEGITLAQPIPVRLFAKH